MRIAAPLPLFFSWRTQVHENFGCASRFARFPETRKRLRRAVRRGVVHHDYLVSGPGAAIRPAPPSRARLASTRNCSLYTGTITDRVVLVRFFAWRSAQTLAGPAMRSGKIPCFARLVEEVVPIVSLSCRSCDTPTSATPAGGSAILRMRKFYRMSGRSTITMAQRMRSVNQTCPFEGEDSSFDEGHAMVLRLRIWRE